MSDRFRKDADRLLSGLTWRQEDCARVLSAVEGAQPMVKRKVGVSFVLALVLALLAAVSLAVGLTYSPKFSVTQTARNALMDAYDLSPDMVRVFFEDITEADGKTVFVYSCIEQQNTFVDAEAMGVYTVTVDAHGNATAAWSHDGVDRATWEDGALPSPVWGAPQLAEVLSRYKTYRQWWADNEGIYDLPLKEQEERFAELAALIAPLKLNPLEGPQDPAEAAAKLEALLANNPPEEPPEPAAEPAPQPKAGDLTAAQAIALAKDAMIAEYGLTEGYDVEAEYSLDQDGSWTVWFYTPDGIGGVSLRASDGEIQKIWLDLGIGGNG